MINAEQDIKKYKNVSYSNYVLDIFSYDIKDGSLKKEKKRIESNADFTICMIANKDNAVVKNYIAAKHFIEVSIDPEMMESVSHSVSVLKSENKALKVSLLNAETDIKDLTKALKNSMEIKAENDNLKEENIKLLSEIKKMKDEIDSFKAALKDNKTKK